MSRFKVAFVAAASLFLAFGAVDARGDIVPGTVSTDPFDSARGTIIVNHDTLADPINAFRTSGGFEDGHTLMREGGFGSVSFIEFDTATPVSIIGVRLFAQDEREWYCDWYPEFCSVGRAMNHFALFADVDGDGVFETLVVETSINPNYALQPGNNATNPEHLDLTLPSALVTAKHWRLEVTQGSDRGYYEGARLVEVDAIPSPDSDGDGLLDDVDQCASTQPGAVVNPNGCSIADICPCGSTWKNHGAYVSCVSENAEAFATDGLIGWEQKDAIVSEAGKSECGKPAVPCNRN